MLSCKHINSEKETIDGSDYLTSAVQKDGQSHLITELGEVEQRGRQYFDSRYNDSILSV